MDKSDMENDAQTMIDSPPSETCNWPGQRLRQAREGMNLSRQEVARKLRLDADLIQALEDNDRDALPAQTYLVGYLRSYARLLNLPADSIIADTQVNLQPTTTLLPDNIDYRNPERFESLLRLVVLGILVALILAMGYWFLGTEPEWLNQWF